MSDEYGTLSVWAPISLADDAEAMAERWDEYTELKTKRSVPARQALELGMTILEMLEDEYGARRVARMDMHEKRAMARQGLVEYFEIMDAPDDADA